MTSHFCKRIMSPLSSCNGSCILGGESLEALYLIFPGFEYAFAVYLFWPSGIQQYMVNVKTTMSL